MGDPGSGEGSGAGDGNANRVSYFRAWCIVYWFILRFRARNAYTDAWFRLLDAYAAVKLRVEICRIYAVHHFDGWAFRLHMMRVGMRQYFRKRREGLSAEAAIAEALTAVEGEMEAMRLFEAAECARLREENRLRREETAKLLTEAAEQKRLYVAEARAIIDEWVEKD